MISKPKIKYNYMQSFKIKIRQIVYKPGSVPIWVAIIHLGLILLTSSRNLPEHLRTNSPSLTLNVFLFGLAPDGVYPALFVTKKAVVSYTTFSPLPIMAVCFLWHFPCGYPRRTLSAIIFVWSPDFPQMKPFGHIIRNHPTI